MFDLVVVPVIVNGGGLSSDEKTFLLNLLFLAFACTGWMMFINSIFDRISSFVIRRKNKKTDSECDKK